MAVAFHPQGDQLASAAYDGTVRLWDLHARSHQVLFRHDGRAYSVAFDSSAERLASSGEDGVLMWDFGQQRAFALGDQKQVSRTAFLAERPILATSNAAGELRLLNVDTGDTLAVLRTRHGERGLHAISPLALTASAN